MTKSNIAVLGLSFIAGGLIAYVVHLSGGTTLEAFILAGVAGCCVGILQDIL